MVRPIAPRRSTAYRIQVLPRLALAIKRVVKRFVRPIVRVLGQVVYFAITPKGQGPPR